MTVEAGTEPGAGHERRRHGIAVAALLVLAAALRLAGTAAEPLWLDEAMTALRATMPLREFAGLLRGDVQLPLYYLVEWAVLAPFDPREVSFRILRLPSAMAGVATVAVVIHLGARACSRRAGLLAGLLVAVTPAAVHYGREARAYALLVLLVALAGWSVLALWERPSLRRALPLAAAFAAAFYTHGVAPFVLLPLGGIPLVAAAARRDGRRFRALLLGTGLAAAAALPWLTVGPRRAADVDRIYTWAESHWEEHFPWQVPRSVAALSPAGPTPTRNLVRRLPATAWVGAALVVVASGIAWIGRRHWRRPEAATLLVATTVASLLGLFAASWALAPIYVIGRTDQGVLPWLALLVGAGLDVAGGAAARRSAGSAYALVGAGAACTLLLAAGPVIDELTSSRRVFDALVAGAVDRHAEDGDVVVHGRGLEPTLQWYLARWDRRIGRAPFPPLAGGHPEWIDWSRHPPHVLAREAEAIARDAVAAAGEHGSVFLLLDGSRGDAWLVEALARRGQLEPVEELPYEARLFRLHRTGRPR